MLGSRLYIRCYNFLSNPLCILRIHMFKPKTRYIYKVKLVCIYLVSLFYGGPLNMYIVQCTPYVIWSLFANVKTKYYITILSPVELWSRCKSLQTIYIITLANQKVFHSLKKLNVCSCHEQLEPCDIYVRIRRFLHAVHINVYLGLVSKFTILKFFIMNWTP